VHVAADCAGAGRTQRPGERQHRCARALDVGPERLFVDHIEVRLAADLPGSRRGNDAELRLHFGEGGFDVEPGLPEAAAAEQFANPANLRAPA
jgi:hypothetical protein